MKKSGMAFVFGSCVLLAMVTGMLQAEPLDVSDEAIGRFLESPFQYDYTTITGDASLRQFVDALDYQLTTIEYRQRREFTAEPGSATIQKRFKGELEDRYRELMRDGFIFKKLNEWQAKTADPINRAFIRFYVSRRNDFTVDPTAIRQAKELSQRIADRLYSFRFEINGEKYSAGDAARIIFGGQDMKLARRLQSLVNDSAAILSRDATSLYFMYNGMGQQRGKRTSLDYSLSRLSFRKPEWLKIADDLKAATDAEYRRCHEFLKREAGIDQLVLFEIEQRLADGAVLPDDYFPPEKIDSAMARLFKGIGLNELIDRLPVKVDSSSYPALAIRLLPPYDNLLLKNNRGGFGNYQRLANELGRALPWVFADTSLPYLLRDYPLGAEELLTGLFETMALSPQFLTENFSIPAEDLQRFEDYRRWQTVSQIRRILLYFYFDYKLSNEQASDPTALYMSLENELFETGDSTYQWIETLLTGRLESFPEELAHTFARIKTIEILHTKFGNGYIYDPAAGKFLIDYFCLPGRSQTIEEYISRHAPDRLSVKDIKRQLQLH